MTKLVDTLDKDLCCACAACVNICPKSCISMTKDSELFAYPQIDHSACIECGMCMKVCPSNTKKQYDINNAKSYAAVNLDENIRYKSSSGGIFYELANLVFAKGGIVYGAAFESDFSVHHIRIEDANELYKIQKSKYFQSDICNIFEQIHKDLKNQRSVLFSGTPCQVAGLTNMPWANNDNLICIDIACHAVPSRQVWNAYLSSLDLKPSDIEYLDFRDKDYPWHNYSMTIRARSGFSLSEPCDKNPFMLGFIYNLYNRPSCHNCPAKGLISGSDITLADFWGIEKVCPEMDDNHGTSLVIVKSEKGRELLTRLSSRVKIVECSNDVFIERKSTFMESSAPHYLRPYFFKKLGSDNFVSLAQASLKHNAPLTTRILRRIKTLMTCRRH